MHIKKAIDSTLLVYEINREFLPREDGFPLRTLALGCMGANRVKWVIIKAYTPKQLMYF